MLGGVFVRHLHQLLARVAENDLAVVAPGRACGVAGGVRQVGDQLGHPGDDALGQRPVRGEEPGGRLVTMFRLPHEIVRDDLGVGGSVRDDPDFGRPREDVDADLSEQHPLGFGDILVAGPDDHVGGFAGEETVGHGGDRLDATERHDDIRARLAHGVEDVWVHAAAPVGCRAGDHGLHPGGLRGGDRHHRRGDMRVAPGRDVAARHVAGHPFLPRLQARGHRHLEALHRVALRQGEGAHLFDGEGDVILDLLGNRRRPRLDFLLRDDDVAVPLVELQRVVPDRILPLGLDAGEHLLDDGLRLGGLGLRCLRRFLEVGDGHANVLSVFRRGCARVCVSIPTAVIARAAPRVRRPPASDAAGASIPVRAKCAAAVPGTRSSPACARTCPEAASRRL